MNIKRFRCLGNRLLVNPQRAENESTIIRPIGAQEAELWRGVVVSKGSAVHGLKNRDVVLYFKKTGMPIEINGHAFVLLRLHDILGKI